MTSLDQDQVRALDRVRTQLLTLRSSLGTLSESLVTQQPLPSATTLQIQANVVSSSLRTLAEQLAEHQQLLSSAHVFPLPQYPGRLYGGILSDTLLRTKLEPNVQEWIEQGESIAVTKFGDRSLSEQDRNELWMWAPNAANKEARKQKWGADYTLDEVKEGVEKISTGLKRELIVPPEDYDEDDDEEDEYDEVTDEEEEAEKMDVEQQSTQVTRGSTDSSKADSTQPIPGKPIYLETMQEFMTTGRIERYEPRLVEIRKEAEKKKQGNMPV